MRKKYRKMMRKGSPKDAKMRLEIMKNEEKTKTLLDLNPRGGLVAARSPWDWIMQHRATCSTHYANLSNVKLVGHRCRKF